MLTEVDLHHSNAATVAKRKQQPLSPGHAYKYYSTDLPLLPQPPAKRRAPTKNELVKDLPRPWYQGRGNTVKRPKPLYPPTLAQLLDDPVQRDGNSFKNQDHDSQPDETDYESSRSSTQGQSEPETDEEEVEDALLGTQFVEDAFVYAGDECQTVLRRVRNRRRKQQHQQRRVTPNTGEGWRPLPFRQHGPERPGEFSREIQHLMNRVSTNRKDPWRAKIFEQMIANADRREQPNAPRIRVFPHVNEGAPEFK